MSLSIRWLYPTAFWCLLLSGIAGLAYQVAWARYLALLLGNTSYGVVAVLVAFMGGLALGNAWLGRYADRLKRPLALYGWLEIGIAVYGILFPTYFEICQRGYIGIATQFSPGDPWLLVLKFAFSFAAILIPATLMGGTLPILTRLVTRSLGELRGRVAGLYFVNSLGAVIGVMVADFWWLPSHGLEVTILGAAALNAVVGALALFVNSGLKEAAWATGTDAGETPAKEAAIRGVDAEAESFSPFELRLAVAAAGVSGFVAMLYEVVWTRILALALGSSTHAFSIMLVTFIAGIATGAWIVGRWKGIRRTFDAFGWIELALAVTLLASMCFYDLLPLLFYRLGNFVARAPENHAVYQGLQFVVCYLVMFVPALCLGMTLPLASRVATSELARTGRSVGLVFSVNTLGTVLGAALTGMVLLPWLGLAPALALGVALNLAIALAVLMRRPGPNRSLAIVGTPLLVGALMVFAFSYLDPRWDRSFSMGLWRVRGEPPTVRQFQEKVMALNLKYHRDGAGSTVAVVGWRDEATKTDQLGLRVNGKTDATSHGDLPTQLLSGHIPMLLHTNATDALVVGIGSGITCGAILTHPEVERLDVVEISPEVTEVARTLFAPHNHGALDHPKSRVIIDDAKSFLKTTGRKYDVIVTEPSNPWMAGVSGVFSLEYYETCLASLKPGGIIAQWVQVYETDDTALTTVIGTFGSVFPYFSVWQTLPGDLLLVGSTSPTAKDLDLIAKRFRHTEVRRDIGRADIHTLPALLTLQLVSENNGSSLVAPDTIRHSDFFPVLEYIAERAFFAQGATTLLDDLDERSLRHPETLLARHLRGTPLTVEDARSIALLHTTSGVPHPRVVRTVLQQWRQMAPADLLPLEFGAKMEYAPPAALSQVEEMAGAREVMMAQVSSNPEPLRLYARFLMNVYRNSKSVLFQPSAAELRTVLEHLAANDRENADVHRLRLAEIAWDLGEEARFLELATEAMTRSGMGNDQRRLDQDFSAPGRILYLLIDTLARRGRMPEALGWCEGVRRGGYLEPTGRYYNRRLAMVVRKLEMEAERIAAAAGTAAGGANLNPR